MNDIQQARAKLREAKLVKFQFNRGAGFIEHQSRLRRCAVGNGVELVARRSFRRAEKARTA